MATPARASPSRALALSGRAVQAGWLLFALAALSLALPGVAAYHELLQTVCEGSGCLPTQLTPAEARAALSAQDSLEDFAALEIAVYLCGAVLLVAAGAGFIWRKPADLAAVLGAFLLVALATSPLAEASARGVPVLLVPARLLALVQILTVVPFFSSIVDGRCRPGWLGWVALAALPPGVLAVAGSVPPFAGIAFGLTVGALVAGGLIHRYRSLVGSPLQERAAWAVAAFGLLVGAQMVGRPIRPLPLPAVPLEALPPSFISFFSVMGLLFLVGAVSCLLVALLGDELLRVDVALNRALVYSLLTLFVVAVYALVVGYLSLVFQSSGSVWFSLIATGLVAVLFQPVRARVQRLVNGLLYGKRDDPYQVIVALGRRLEMTLEPATILPAIVQTVRDSLELPYVAITLHQAADAPLTIGTGAAKADPLRFPLVLGGETLGELLVSPRRGEGTLTPADRRLLTDLAQQAGVAVHVVSLMADLRSVAADLQRTTADLQRSREQLVLAREEERRRLRRDLHDDLAPTLAGLALKARTISDLLPTDPAKAGPLADGLHEALRDTVGNIRRLVYDLRPPALDELGLVAAIRDRAAQYGEHRVDGQTLRVTVEAPERLPPLPAAVEVAAYRIVQEAMANIARHSQARTCRVRIALDSMIRYGMLRIEVADDGIGLADERSPGIGLRSMQERAMELGGTWEIVSGEGVGTQVRASLPLVDGGQG